MATVDARRRAGVFWDYANCPPPSQSSGFDAAESIASVASEYGCTIQSRAYLDLSANATTQPISEKTLLLRSELQSSGISLIECPSNGRKDVADKMIIADVMAFCLDNPAPCTIIILSGDRDFAYTVSLLRQRLYTVVMIVPPDNAHISLIRSASVVINWRDILPVPKSSSLPPTLPSTPSKWRERTSAISPSPNVHYRPPSTRASMASTVTAKQDTTSKTATKARPFQFTIPARSASREGFAADSIQLPPRSFSPTPSTRMTTPSVTRPRSHSVDESDVEPRTRWNDTIPSRTAELGSVIDEDETHAEESSVTDTHDESPTPNPRPATPEYTIRRDNDQLSHHTDDSNPHEMDPAEVPLPCSPVSVRTSSFSSDWGRPPNWMPENTSGRDPDPTTSESGIDLGQVSYVASSPEALPPAPIQDDYPTPRETPFEVPEAVCEGQPEDSAPACLFANPPLSPRLSPHSPVLTPRQAIIEQIAPPTAPCDLVEEAILAERRSSGGSEGEWITVTSKAHRPTPTPPVLAPIPSAPEWTNVATVVPKTVGSWNENPTYIQTKPFAYFILLIDILEKWRKESSLDQYPNWGRVGQELKSRNSGLYERVGVSSFKEFITLAHAAGIVKLGESRWGPTVSLQKKWRNWMDV